MAEMLQARGFEEMTLPSSHPLTASKRRGKSTLSFQRKRVAGLFPTDTMPCGEMQRSWSVKWPN